MVIMAHLQMLYSEWLVQDLVGRIHNKSPPIIFSLASLGFGGKLSQLKGEVLMCRYFNDYCIDLRSDETFVQ